MDVSNPTPQLQQKIVRLSGEDLDRRPANIRIKESVVQHAIPINIANVDPCRSEYVILTIARVLLARVCQLASHIYGEC